MIRSLKIKRKIPLSKIHSVTVSRLGYEFVIHVEDEYDYRFSCEKFVRFFFLFIFLLKKKKYFF